MLKLTTKEKKLFNYIKILSDASKYKIILYLMKGEDCVCTIAKNLKLEQSLVSHHLKKLREMNLVQDRKVGPWVHVSLNKKIFQEMEELYNSIFSSKLIAFKFCSAHELCKALLVKNIII